MCRQRQSTTTVDCMFAGRSRGSRVSVCDGCSHRHPKGSILASLLTRTRGCKLTASGITSAGYRRRRVPEARQNLAALRTELAGASTREIVRGRRLRRQWDLSSTRDLNGAAPRSLPPSHTTASATPPPPPAPSAIRRVVTHSRPAPGGSARAAPAPATCTPARRRPRSAPPAAPDRKQTAARR